MFKKIRHCRSINSYINKILIYKVTISKKLITFYFTIACLTQISFAQKSVQIPIDSAPIQQKDSIQIAADSIQKENSIQISKDSIQLKWKDSVKITIASTQMIQEDSGRAATDSIHIGQDLIEIPKYNSPYTTSFKKDAPIIAAGVGLTAFGVYLIQNKKDLTAEQLISKTKDNVPFFDRGNAGFYSKKTNDASYIPFETAFAMPVVLMLINKNERQMFRQIFGLYVETMAITGSMFTIAAGTVNRSRPLVYSTTAPLPTRLAGKSQRSFYAGHTAATSAATFFAARVFQDFNPDSKAKPYVWTVAAIIPAVTGYLRYKAGMHFLSDNILGYVIGAGTGILIPKWHKNKALRDFTVMPGTGDNYKGISVNYHF